jgi:hypothetical protein
LYTTQMHNLTVTFKAFWQYFSVPSILGSGLLAYIKLRYYTKPHIPYYLI